MTTYSEIKSEVSFAGLLLRWGLILLLVFGILGGIARAMGFISFAFWAPKVEQVRYNTFKESQSYNDGMVRDLQDLRMTWLAATPDQRILLRSTILQRFSVYDRNRLPPELQSFYYTIQGVSQ